MGLFFKYKANQAVFGIFLLIQLVTFAYSYDCPENLAKECKCLSLWGLLECSKNNETIRISIAPYPHQTPYLKIQCENVSSASTGEIYNLLNFSANGLATGSITAQFEYCPASFMSSVANSVINHAKTTSFFIITNNVTILYEKFVNNEIKLEKLTLNGINETTLPEHIFDNFTYLGELTISNNQFTTLSEHHFEKLFRLYTLTISGNKLTSLPDDIFKNLPGLEYLSLNENGFTEFPLTKNIFHHKSMYHMPSLFVSGNKFTSLPDGVFDEDNLLHLALSENQLASLPENIFKNQESLKYLFLDGNRLTTLPETIFERQSSLKLLDLEKNNLISLPENIFNNNSELGTLFLNHNNLTTLPENIFKNLTNLFNLRLNNNKLTSLSENLFMPLVRLSELRLDGNDLTTLPEGIFNHLRASIDFSLKIELKDNPWKCDCGFLNFVREHQKRQRYVAYSAKIKCTDGVTVKDKLLSKQC